MTALELAAQHLDAAVRDLRSLRREQPSTWAEQVRLERRLRVARRGVVELEARFAALLGVNRLADPGRPLPHDQHDDQHDDQEEHAA